MTRQAIESQRLWEQWHRTGDDRDRDAVIESVYRLVDRTLRRRRFPGYVDPEDLRAAVVYEMIRAVDSYDPRHGKSLDNWIILKVRAKALDYCRTGPSHEMTRWVWDHCSRYDLARSACIGALGRTPTHEEICAHLGVDQDRMSALLGRRDHIRHTNSTQYILGIEMDSEGDERVEGTIHLTTPGPGPDHILISLVRDWLETTTRSRDAEMLQRTLIGDETRHDVAPDMQISYSRAHQIYHEALRRLRDHLAAAHGITAETW